MSKPLLAAISLAGAAFLYSFFGVLTRTVGFDLPIFFASFTRDLLGASILLLPLFFAKKFQKVNKADWPWLFLRTCGGVLGFLGSYYAFYYLPIGTAYFIFYGGSTVTGFLLGVFLFKEKMSLFEGLSLGLSLIGLVMIYSIGGVDMKLLPYVVWALLGGVGAGVWNTFSKKVSDNYSATQLNGLDFAIFTLIMGSISLFQGETWSLPNLNSAWIGSLVFATMFVITGQLIIYGFKYLDAQKGSLIMLLEVVFGAVIGFLFYKEVLSFGTLIGGLLILLGAILPQLNKKA